VSTTGERHPYTLLVSRRAAPDATAWFIAQYDRLVPASFTTVYAATGRRLGTTPFEPAADEAAELERSSLPVPLGWPLSAVGRAALLAKACGELTPAEHAAFVARVFKTGDNAERAALLRALQLLPEPERFVETAMDACRSSVQSVFEAIACENPYPARFFPDLNFNQLVLKAFFTEVPVRRIVGLEQRRTDDLVRMAEGYASERRAAGRSIPRDLHVVTGKAPPAERSGPRRG
jgi:hypothetical protein